MTEGRLSFTFAEFCARFNERFGPDLRCEDWDNFRQGRIVAKLDFEIPRGTARVKYDLDPLSASYRVEKLTGLDVEAAIDHVVDVAKPFGPTHVSFKYTGSFDSPMPDDPFCFALDVNK
jgi:hypothetical protein